MLLTDYCLKKVKLAKEAQTIFTWFRYSQIPGLQDFIFLGPLLHRRYTGQVTPGIRIMRVVE